VTAPLQIADTVPVEEIRHRLTLGLSLVDALTGIGAAPPLRADLETIGPYAFPATIGADRQAMRFEMHGAAKHAVRYAGRIRKLIDKAVARPAAPTMSVRIYAPLDATQSGYDPAREARRYVPRRLRLLPAMDGDQPAPTPDNIRSCWLWPGSAYPKPAAATAIAGRVLRGPSVAAATPIPWARVFATTPPAAVVFDADNVVGVGHGDDRGEFLMMLQQSAVQGAALSNPVSVRLWAFVPPVTPPPDPRDALAGLPIEDAGVDTTSDVLSGRVAPPGYSQQISTLLDLRLAETTSNAATTLLLA
jgi:hypothetical protein